MSKINGLYIIDTDRPAGLIKKQFSNYLIDHDPLITKEEILRDKLDELEESELSKNDAGKRITVLDILISHEEEELEKKKQMIQKMKIEKDELEKTIKDAEGDIKYIQESLTKI
jgi:peptidoglycan hydrolase CwlO-like protein